MSNFDCSQSCKKTKQLRASTHCNQKYEIIDGKVLFGCDKSLKGSTREQYNYNTCDFWNMDISEACISCPLSCHENKNPIVKKTKDASESISNLLNSLGPMLGVSGIDPISLKKANDIMSSHNINTNNSAEIEPIINLTNYAKNVLNSIMSGNAVDIAEFKKIKDLVEKKYSKK